MSTNITSERPPAPDWLSITDDELVTYRTAENRFRASAAARVATGEPDPAATISWETVLLPDRELPLRVHRPAPEVAARTDLPLVLHVHGGGFVGTAVQSDWVNSHLAVRLSAVVISVEHRLLDRDTPLSAAADDGWDVLQHVVRHAGRWGIDPSRVAVFGESCGGLICALAAIRAARTGMRLRAQVLVNPAVDVTETMLENPSVAEHGDSPALCVPQLQLVRRLGVPPDGDARAVSPLHADGHDGLAPALVLVPTHDPLADQGRRYAQLLAAAGTPTRMREHYGAPHAFLSTPGLAPHAQRARVEIREFLRPALAPDLALELEGDLP
jgi:acetyl esterase